MQTIFKNWALRVVAVLSCCSTSICHASYNNPRKMIIHEGAYKFYASYKLQNSAEANDVPSELIVRAHIGCDPVLVKHLNARAIAGRFGTELFFDKDSIQIYYDGRKIDKFNTDTTHSKLAWAPALDYLLKKIGITFYKIDPYGRKKDLRNLQFPVLPPSFKIQSEKVCKLSAQYSIHNPHVVPRHSSLAQRIIVDVITQEKKMKRFNGEKIVVITALFYTQKRPQIGDSKSILRFVKTKNGFQKIGSKNSSKIGMWQSWVKKICERSVKKYIRYKRVHEKCNFVNKEYCSERDL